MTYQLQPVVDERSENHKRVYCKQPQPTIRLYYLPGDGYSLLAKIHFFNSSRNIIYKMTMSLSHNKSAASKKPRHAADCELKVLQKSIRVSGPILEKPVAIPTHKNRLRHFIRSRKL